MGKKGEPVESSSGMRHVITAGVEQRNVGEERREVCVRKERAGGLVEQAPNKVCCRQKEPGARVWHGKARPKVFAHYVSVTLCNAPGGAFDRLTGSQSTKHRTRRVTRGHSTGVNTLTNCRLLVQWKMLADFAKKKKELSVQTPRRIDYRFFLLRPGSAHRNTM